MGRPATGSVRYEGGRWKARVTVNGRERLIDIDPPITDPKARAQAVVEARALADLARGFTDGSDPESELARDWFDRWLADKKARGQSAWTACRSHAKCHILTVIGTTPMRTVTKRQLETIVQSLDAAVARGEIRWKAASNIWSTVTKAFDDAHRSKVLELRVRDDNPAKDVRGPDRGVATAKVHLYPGEFLDLVSAPAVPRRRRRFYTLGIYCYMRPSEVEALRWEDIDLERETIHIRRGFDAERDETSPKAGRARSPFNIEPNLMPLLRAMHAESGGHGLVIGSLVDYWERAEYLRADLLAAGVTRRELHEACDDPPREWMTAHDLRTTGITWMAVEGVRQPLEIMARAGHAELAQTQGYIDTAALVRRGYGAVFPQTPASLLEEVSGEVSGVTSRSSGKRLGLSVEDMGIENKAVGVASRSAATIATVKGAKPTPDHVRDPAGSHGSPETSPDIPPARAARHDQLVHAIRKALARQDWQAVEHLASALADDARAIRLLAAPEAKQA